MRPDCKVYDNATEGSLDEFDKMSEATGTSGRIFVHDTESMNVYIHFHHLRERIRNGTQIWSIPRLTLEWPTFAPIFDGKLRGCTLTRLFPPRSAVHMPLSLVEEQPFFADEILRWLLTGPNPQCGTTAAGAFRLVLAPHFMDQVFELASSKARERFAFEKSYQGESLEEDLEKAGLGRAQCNLRFQMYCDLRRHGVRNLKAAVEPDSNDNVKSDGFESDDILESEYDKDTGPIYYIPTRYKGNLHMQRDHFAGWALLNLQNFGKFIVLGPLLFEEHRERWQHVDFVENQEDVRTYLGMGSHRR
ncbi:hypothetical protein ONS95_013576 [Cadophora gregata]|uniref:uncharacterized protein n=1 Tax=Cadophora gregata TaxID=51156 RepID=UPI0026DB0007|nr:uncharacterized protein ONS95_013576 [Cadophora gregata]KAK0114071.1 hypothetical protein ONS95_013576 [Cadophora gregata]